MKHPRMTVHFEWASRDIRCIRRIHATNLGVQRWVWSIVILVSCHARKRSKSQWIPIWIASLGDSWARMTILHTQSRASEVVTFSVLMHLESICQDVTFHCNMALHSCALLDQRYDFIIFFIIKLPANF